MDSHGIDVLHVTDDDATVVGIPHDLELDLLPSQDRFLDQDLVDTAVCESVGGDLPEFGLVVSDSSSGTSQCEGGPYQDGISSDLVRCCDVFVDRVDAFRHGDGFPDLHHGLFEQFPVL